MKNRGHTGKQKKYRKNDKNRRQVVNTKENNKNLGKTTQMQEEM